MYADDTTVYVSAPTFDLVASKLNEVLARLYTWCCENCLTPHPTKTEYMLLSGCRQLTGPKQAIKMGDYVIEEVVSTRCLGVQIDNALKWDHHVSELAKSFTKKLNLLKSLYFLPRQARTDFYFGVILPSVTYGMLVWGSNVFLKPGIHTCQSGKNNIQLRLVYAKQGGSGRSKMEYLGDYVWETIINFSASGLLSSFTMSYELSFCKVCK